MTIAFPARAFRRQRERTPGLLFAFGVDDLSTDVPTGQTLTYDRNGQRSVLDSAGRVATLAYDQVPWGATYNSTAGVWEPVYDSYRATTNLCVRSEDFGTTWSSIGTPTRTAAAKTCGDVTLDLIGDDAAGTLEGYSQVVSFTGNAVKAVSVFLAAGTSTSTVIRLRDTSASANRLLATIAWASGVPTVTMTTGSDVGTITCYNGTYRFVFQTTSVTAANTNQIEVYPATTSALVTTSTGTVYAGGVQAENAEYPRGYLKTLGSTVTSVVDSLTCPVTFPVADFTLYVRLARPHWAALGSVTSFPYLVGITPTSSAYWQLDLTTSSQFRCVLYDGSTSANAYGTMVAGAMIDICVQFVNVASALKARMDVGGGFEAYSSTLGAVSAWGGTTLQIGPADGGIRRIAMAAGARTLSEMRGAQP